MLLIETRITKPIVESNDKGQLPEGVLCRVTYPICNIGERNANNRIYEQEVWEGVFGNKDLMEKISNRALFGHAEHPEQTQSNLEKTSHVICEMWQDEGKVFQKIDVLDTPTGRIVGTLLKAGCNVGMSTRADGDLEESEDDDGQFSRVIPESYRYITTDFTADPSTFGAIPYDVQHNITREAKSVLESDGLHASERQFAQMICESMEKLSKDYKVKTLSINECVESSRIVEGSILKHGDKDVVVSLDEKAVTLTINGEPFSAEGNGYVAIQADGTMFLCPEPEMEVMPMEEPMVEPEGDLGDDIVIEEPLDDEAAPLEDDEEEEDEYDELPEGTVFPEDIKSRLLECGLDEGVLTSKDFRAIAAMILDAEDAKELGKDIYLWLRSNFNNFDAGRFAKAAGLSEAVEEAVEEETDEDFIDMQVDEASMRAERDKAIELLEAMQESVTGVNEAWKKDRVFEIKVLSTKLKESKEAVEKAKSAHMNQCGRQQKEIMVLEGKVESLTKQINESKKLVESKANEAVGTTKKLEEQIATLEVAKVTAISESDKAIANLKESHVKLVESKIEETKKAVGAKVTSDFVKRFIRIRVKESNIKLSRNSQTLLEECTTLDEVDSLMDEIVDAKRRRSALHTKANEHVQPVRHKPVDPETKIAKKAIESVFEGMNHH